MLLNLSDDEAQRLEAIALLRMRTPDQARDEILNNFVQLAASCLGTSGSFVSVLDNTHQYITAAQNIPFRQACRQDTLCRFVVEDAITVVIPDMLEDPRSSDHPLVRGEPHVRFYAGTPLRTSEGVIMGTLCVTDTRPHRFSPRRRKMLELLACLVMEFLQTWLSSGFTDAVTGLTNRQALVRDLQHRAAGGKDGRLRLVIIECIDIPKIHELARSVGMLPVEALLRDAGTLLRLQLNRPRRERLYSISAGRYVVLSEEADQFTAASVLARLQNVTATLEQGISVDLTVSAGEACFHPSETSAQEGLRRAESALHEAVSSGGGLKIFDALTDARRNDEFRLMHDLAAALHGEAGLYVVYQPKVCMATAKLTGLEALIRWHHPARGELSPAAFLPAAARTRLHGELADWVIGTVMKQLVQWQAAGCAIPVSINLSESDFTREGFICALYEGIMLAGLTPALIEVECLETEKIIENESAIAVLATLRGKGFRIALDDFGAGYSNVSYLKRMPMDVIKLDRLLISDIATESRSRIIVTSVISMLKALEYTVVAEGVEDGETAAVLAQAGCDIAQGYYYSRPLPAADITRMLQRSAGLG
ncbi:EAL domain-containing protein [Pseudomonas cerasi]